MKQQQRASLPVATAIDKCFMCFSIFGMKIAQTKRMLKQMGKKLQIEFILHIHRHIHYIKLN